MNSIWNFSWQITTHQYKITWYFSLVRKVKVSLSDLGDLLYTVLIRKGQGEQCLAPLTMKLKCKQKYKSLIWLAEYFNLKWPIQLQYTVKKCFTVLWDSKCWCIMCWTCLHTVQGCTVIWKQVQIFYALKKILLLDHTRMLVCGTTSEILSFPPPYNLQFGLVPGLISPLKYLPNYSF